MAAGGQGTRAEQEGARGQDVALALLLTLPSLSTPPSSHHSWPEVLRCPNPHEGPQGGRDSAQLGFSPSVSSCTSPRVRRPVLCCLFKWDYADLSLGFP